MGKVIKILPAMIAIPLLVCMSLGLVTACSDDNKSSQQEKNLLVNKIECNATYIASEVAEYLPVKAHDITEIKYDANGNLTEWWSNGECGGRYSDADGKILVSDVPDFGSFEHILSPSGQVIETRYSDGTADKLSYDDTGRCIAINENVNSSTPWHNIRFHWTGTEMTHLEYEVEGGIQHIHVTYTDTPKKGNAPCLRTLMLFTSPYWPDLEVSGHLNISSDKYLPEKVVVEWQEGYTQIYDTTYELNTDGTVKSMHIVLKDGFPESDPDNMRLCYDGVVTFSYLEL